MPKITEPNKKPRKRKMLIMSWLKELDEPLRSEAIDLRIKWYVKYNDNYKNDKRKFTALSEALWHSFQFNNKWHKFHQALVNEGK